jgi:outer membrane receptor protein involved in Fe transport
MESSGAVYAENDIQWARWLRSTVGIREDQFDFDVTDKMRGHDGICNIDSDPLGCDSGSRRASLFSPKAGLVLGPWAKTTLYLNFGYGYHSNDARGVTRSPPYTTVDLELGYGSSDRWRATLDVFNVANVKWNDIEYYYASRLRDEPTAMADHVVHPGVPRLFRIQLQYRF